MSLSKLANPPLEHPLNRDYGIGMKNRVQHEQHVSSMDQYKTNVSVKDIEPVLALTMEPHNPPMKLNVKPEEPKPKKIKTEAELEEQKHKEKLEEKKAEEEMKKYITVEVSDYDEEDEDNDKVSELLQFKFDLVLIPSEDGTTNYTYIQNHKDFTKLTKNCFELAMIYFTTKLKTSYKHDKHGNDDIWYLESECDEDKLNDIKLDYIYDCITCDNCYGCNTLLLKDSKNKLIRICALKECNTLCEIEYTKSDDEALNESITIMIQEYLKLVSLYSPIVISFDKQSRPEPKPKSAKDQKLYDTLNDIINGKTPSKPGHHGHHGHHYSSITHPLLNRGRGRGILHQSNNAYIPPARNSGNRTGGYNVKKYGNYYNTSSSLPVSSSYAQNIDAAKKHYNLETTNDNREYFTYTDTKKDKFQAYVRFLSNTVREQNKIMSHNRFNNNTRNPNNNYWGLSSSALLTKAKELDILDIAVMANVMILFDDDILLLNQLNNKRKYLLPFINHQPEISSLYFLFGIEIIIHNYKDKLMDKADEIMTTAYQQNYFTIEIFDKWFNSHNSFLNETKFEKDLRHSLKQWRKFVDDTGEIHSSGEEEADDESEEEQFNAELFPKSFDEPTSRLLDEPKPFSNNLCVPANPKNVIRQPFLFKPSTLSISNPEHESLLI